MGRNDGSRDTQSGKNGNKTDAAGRKEDWKNKNGPVIVVAVAVGLVVLMSVAMKTCG